MPFLAWEYFHRFAPDPPSTDGQQSTRRRRLPSHQAHRSVDHFLTLMPQ
ncbi:predicted protein [Plenodomus lingam JN3]|uniref:Uncharacterized protein n=1 Tax=Leptosphaeria maculans (strain JN3 / isolate v23.1.3 / race Av1-4-5-6-7-8) TaxID=985895 RepID=E5A7P6_LEPMJ|nr:predicted protein [Plenodomus lingam JN3]CBX99641.1 predicted protein [Plenodomus lingam JN3]